MEPFLIDAHCHLDHLGMDGAVEFLTHLHEKQLEAVVVSGISARDWPFYATLASRFHNMGVCYGIHPLEITDAWEAHLEQLRTFLPKAVALGEIGLDFHNLFDIAHVAQMKLQMKVFERQLRLAAHYQLPVVIHCRDAFFAIREMLEYAHFDVQRVLFHCFVEDAQATEWILSRGGMVSYSGVLTFKRCGHTPITAAMADLDHIVVETDSPYLAPVPFRGQQNSPEYVRHVVAKLAEVKQLPYDVCAAATVRNAQRFFGL